MSGTAVNNILLKSYLRQHCANLHALHDRLTIAVKEHTISEDEAREIKECNQKLVLLMAEIINK